jgi:hypothetical protein
VFTFLQVTFLGWLELKGTRDEEARPDFLRTHVTPSADLLALVDDFSRSPLPPKARYSMFCLNRWLRSEAGELCVEAERLAMSKLSHARAAHATRSVRFQAQLRWVLFPVLGRMYVMSGSEAPHEDDQRLSTINLWLSRHRLADLMLEGVILLAVDGRLMRLLARLSQGHLKQIPPMGIDLQGVFRRNGRPGVLDCALPLSAPDDDAAIAPVRRAPAGTASGERACTAIDGGAAILFEPAVGPLGASEVVTVPGMPVAPIREYAMHCASPQFAPDPVWSARVLLEHYLDCRTQWMVDAELNANLGYDVLPRWTEDFLSL